MSRALFGLASILFAAACASSAHDGVSTAAPPTASASAQPPIPTAAPRPARSSDPMWVRAAGEDEAEKVRLAEAVGATELVLALDDESVAKAALASLPYAPDADLALGPLAASAKKANKSAMRSLLETILAIARRPRAQRELLDPEGVRAAGAILLELSGRKDLGRDHRALAVSAARALAEKGYVDATRIPTDLDPSGL